jgi:DNA-binding CsgD family transcriptional regulator
LFLSTKTVSANLTRIYRKLGVRNRAELTASLAARISG